MTEQQSQALLTFFQFAFLNQVLAEEAAQQAYQRIDQLSKTKSDESFDVQFVKVTNQVYKQFHQASQKGKAGSVQSALSTHSSDLDLSPWRDYFKSASADELTVVVWSLILKLPMKAVSQALDLSPGTLHHRLGRAVRKLSVKLETAPTPQVRRPWN